MIHRLRAAWSSLWSADSSAPPDWRNWNRQLRNIRQLEASYEAALQRDDLWQLADFRDADATLLPGIRRQIRSRARYERANNPLVNRILNVWAGDVVGEAGPWLQVKSGNSEVNHFIEQAWLRWWQVSNQTAKLRTSVYAEAADGESVSTLINNPRLRRDQHPDSWIAVDVRNFESDRLASPRFEDANYQSYVDGVHLDTYTDEPTAYDLLRAHPGTQDIDELSELYEFTTYAADDVLHCFDKLRPEQHRGVCRYVSALPLSGIMRKCVEAEATRMQIIAAFTFIIKSMVPPEEEGGEGGNEDQWWQEISLPNRQGIGMFMPEGYDVSQFEAKGQAGNIDLVNRLVAGHIAGCFAMPLGHALGQYGATGYAPIRGEMLPYHRAITTARTTIWEPHYLRPLYHAFLAELRLSPAWQQLLERLATATEQPFPVLDLTNLEFKWPGRELIVDPSREEEARRKRLSMGLSTREDEIDTNDLDEHDRRAARGLGFGDDAAALTAYRQLCAASIHQVQQPLASSTSEPESTSEEPDPEQPTPPQAQSSGSE